MPTTLLLETNENNQPLPLRHYMLRLSMLALLLAPWSLIAISLMVFHMIAAHSTMLLVCTAVVVVAIPAWLHFLAPVQHHHQPMANI